MVGAAAWDDMAPWHRGSSQVTWVVPRLSSLPLRGGYCCFTPCGTAGIGWGLVWCLWLPWPASLSDADPTACLHAHLHTVPGHFPSCVSLASEVVPPQLWHSLLDQLDPCCPSTSEHPLNSPPAVLHFTVSCLLALPGFGGYWL